MFVSLGYRLELGAGSGLVGYIFFQTKQLVDGLLTSPVSH